VHVTVLNWSKYNPKRAQKSYTWLRLNNDVFSSQDLHGLTLEEKAVWIYLLCFASRKNTGTIEINAAHASHLLGTKTAKVDKALKSFEKLGLVALSLHHTTPSTTPTDETDETDETRRTNETDAPTPDKPADRGHPEVLDKVSVSTSRQNWEFEYPQIEAWNRAYSPDFVDTELKKALAWLEANSHKSPKNFPRFFTNWLSRGWESERKLLPSNRAAPKGIAEVLREKAEREKK